MPWSANSATENELPADTVAQELIVLLTADSPSAPEVVEAIHEGQSLPEGLGEGEPIFAELVIKNRARGELAVWMENNPERPLSRLERYVVLRYAENAPIEAIADTLEDNAYIQHVERNQ